MEVLLNLSQLAQTLKLSRPTIYRMMEYGLPFVTIGKTRRFDLDAVIAWIESDAPKEKIEKNNLPAKTKKDFEKREKRRADMQSCKKFAFCQNIGRRCPEPVRSCRNYLPRRGH